MKGEKQKGIQKIVFKSSQERKFVPSLYSLTPVALTLFPGDCREPLGADEPLMVPP